MNKKDFQKEFNNIIKAKNNIQKKEDKIRNEIKTILEKQPNNNNVCVNCASYQDHVGLYIKGGITSYENMDILHELFPNASVTANNQLIVVAWVIDEKKHIQFIK